MIRPQPDSGKMESGREGYIHRSSATINDRLARVGERLARITAAMRDPHFELDATEGAGVIAAYNMARAVGYPVEDLADALFTVLKRQLAATFEAFEDDSDSDTETDDVAEVAA